jgi:hypothetical protein
MFDGFLAYGNIVHLGAALYCAGFLFRNQVTLRAFVIAGDLVYIGYFYFAPAAPLWGAIFWSGVFTLVNVVMISRILADRTGPPVREEELRMFRLLDGLSPGEFRQLMKSARWHSAEVPTVLTEENKLLDRLYYVLDGVIAIDKGGRRVTIGPGTFIGEVAFLLSRPASATVTVESGARYVTWESAALRRLLERTPSLTVSLGAALNKDMAEKVARA